MRKLRIVMVAMLTICFLAACSSDDDLETGDMSLKGTWDLVEVLNGPSGMCQDGYSTQYSSGTVIIELTDSGKIIFRYQDRDSETLDFTFSKDQEQFNSSMPVVYIGEIPFGYAVEGRKLKLHYLGVYFCDHIPATFVFRRL